MDEARRTSEDPRDNFTDKDGLRRPRSEGEMMQNLFPKMMMLALIASAWASGPAAAQSPAPSPMVAPRGLLDPAFPDAEVYIGTPQAAAEPSGPACKLAAHYVELVNAGQYAAVAALFADDATFLEPMRPNLQGRAQIDAFYTKRIGAMQPQVRAIGYFGSDTECMIELTLQTRIAGQQRYVLVSVDHFILGPGGRIKSMVAFARPARTTGG
jgi:hypothetical protein